MPFFKASNRTRAVFPGALALAFGLAVAGCATSGNSDPYFGQRTVGVDESGNLVRTSTTAAPEEVFDAPPAKVWQALEAAYGALGIKVAVNNPSTHTMGNPNFYKTGRLNGQPLTRFADCGSGPDGPRAANDRVYFSVVTTLTALDAGHTKLSTRVEPVAVDVRGNSSDRMTCGTTGRLEQMLYETVGRALSS